MKITLKRTVNLPDPVRIARLRGSPELGPKILFFSGGSALREVSRELINYTFNSIHLISPFDSGGSSAKLRDAFKMPAIGDVRNRLMALADQSLRGNPEIFKLFAYRLEEQGEQAYLRHHLDLMITGKDPMVRAIPDPMRKIIRNHLHQFRGHMPDNFDLRNASIGNLVLTAGYLNNQRHIDPVIFIFSNLVQVRGLVQPIVAKFLHLGAELENGEIIIGQHLVTGKEVPPIENKIVKLFLSKDPEQAKPTQVRIRPKVEELILDANLICYPMGSFYSSIIANFLPQGVGRAVSRNPCPKVFIPNTFEDPELHGTGLMDQVHAIVSYLRRDDPAQIRPRDVMDFVLMDSKNGRYPGGLDFDELERMGIRPLDCPLVNPGEDSRVDASLIVPILLSLS